MKKSDLNDIYLCVGELVVKFIVFLAAIMAAKVIFALFGMVFA